jgi:hypothetical protein
MSALLSASCGPREPDADAIGSFVYALFRYADDGSLVSLRAFPQLKGGPPPYIRGSKIDGAGLDSVIADAINGARFAANYREPLVFCPPVATFRCAKKADEAGMVNGIGISVELDVGNTADKRQFLEHLLGNATCVVTSGGEWTNPDTGELFPKLHLHWRLSEPTRSPDEHAALKYARKLACALVAADPTATTSVHPLRWPGSWHLKGAPKLAGLVALNDAAEVHLQEALEALQDAAEQAGMADQGITSPQANGEPQALLWLLQSALEALPNDDVHWDLWNKIGMAAYRTRAGSDDGLEAWIAWSAKSDKHAAEVCEDRWKHFHTSPPTKIGFGTTVFLAKAGGWVRPRIEETDATEPDPADYAVQPGGEAPAFVDPWSDPPPPEFPGGVLSREMENTVFATALRNGFCPGVLAMAYLAAASGAASKASRFTPYTNSPWWVPPIVWVMPIADSGQRKTAIEDIAFAALRVPPLKWWKFIVV